MNNVTKKIMLSILLILLIVGTIMLYMKGYTAYFIVSFALSIVVFIVLVTSISLNKSGDEKYERDVNNILKIYDAILVKSNNYPKIKNRNIIRVDNIEDLVDAQLEIRKPIYYIKQIDSCCFIILDTTEALVFIMRKNNDVKCAIDIDLEDFDLMRKKDNKSKDRRKDNLLDDIYRTTILKLTNTRSFKISPVKEKKKKKEYTSNTEELNSLREDILSKLKTNDIIPEEKKEDIRTEQPVVDEVKIDEEFEEICARQILRPDKNNKEVDETA